MSGFDLAQWAKLADLMPLTGYDQDLVAVGDQEISYHIAKRDQRFAVERVSRGGPRQLMGTFPTEDTAKVFLIAVIGRIRFHPNLPPVAFDPAEALPEGPMIRSRDAEFPRTHSGLLHARLFEQIADARPDQLASSYSSPKGNPLFSRSST